MLPFRHGYRWIELDEDIAGFDALAVADANRAHDPGLERLDDFSAAGGNDLAWRGGDDVDFTQASPGKGQTEEADDRCADGAAGRRRRISANGQYVAFHSSESDLVTGDTNNTYDVFVRDIQTGTVTRVSTDANGNQSTSPSGDGLHGSFNPSISADGRYVAFQSDATNLVPGDNTLPGTTFHPDNVYVKDVKTGAITRLSVDSNGNLGNGNSFYPHISADGRYVVFASDASNLVPDDTNGSTDLFVVETGFASNTAPVLNPPPPAGTTANVILRRADGAYEIYDIGNNAILAGYELGHVGTDWQFVGLGGFFGSDSADMMLRNTVTGAFQVYDTINNNITATALLGQVGLEWNVAGFGH